MLKLITQNRRGTTSEWAESLIVPLQGEVVLEECDDGITRIKIGDGKSLFKDLKYPEEKILTQLQSMSTRIDNIVSVENIASEDPMYELVDIRAGYDGVSYESAGAAVRSIGQDVSDLRGSLSQFINAKAVDGLFYEDNLLYLTAAGVIVSSPVEILAGSGGSGGSTSAVKLKNENGSSALTASKNDSVILKFTFSSLEDEEETGDGTAVIYVEDEVKLTSSIKQGYTEIDVTKYLKSGTNTVKLVCSDIYGVSRTLTYTVNIIELSISSTFDATSVYTSDIAFKYTPYGLVDKTIHFFIDGKEIAKKEMSASGKQNTQIIPVQPHGVHSLDVFVTTQINDSIVYSNHLLYDVLFVSSEQTDPMIASVYTTDMITQGELVSIPYIVYDPTRLDSNITLSIIDSDGAEVYSQNLIVDRLQQWWNTRTYPQDRATFRISYAGLVKEHVVTILQPEVDIEAEEDSLQLHLTSAGRSNKEQNPAIWKYNDIETSFEGFNWESNGWIIDSNGDTCLRLTGDARAEISLPLFKTDFKPEGKTIEFEFAIRDVNNRDAVVIDCFSEDRGLKMTADTALFKSLSTEVKCNYKDEEKIRVSFTIDDNKELSARLVTVYIDGVLSGAQQYPNTDDFEQNEPVNIRLGSSYCGLDLYNVRVYNTSLSPMQMTNNYIADIPNVLDKMNLFDDNDIYDEFKNISYEKIKKKIPVITFTGKMPTYKGDKKKKSVRMKFEYPESYGEEYTSLNFDEVLDQIDVQGTSSQFYVRKNWKTKHATKHQHMPGEVPAKVFCMKVDYAEATGTHNTQGANFVETLYSEKIPPQLNNDEEFKDKIRTTITGFPCVIFEKETEDSEPVFSSKANFNFDKDAENAFGFTDDYDTECWEFCNNTSGQCNFLNKIQDTTWIGEYKIGTDTKTQTFTNCSSVDDAIDRANQYLAEKKELDPVWIAASLEGVRPSWLDDFEARYAQNFITDASGNEVEYDGDPIAKIERFKTLHDWVVSTATYTVDAAGGKTPIVSTPLSEPVVISGKTYTEDNVEYRLAKFRSEFTNYFDLHYSSIYYVYTFFCLMTDQRAKNMFLTYWDADGDGQGKWYPYFYDNDTSWGINNEGALVFDYYHEDTDKVGNANVYNGQNSVLWTNFRECFGGVIEETYRELRQDKLTYDKLIDQFITKGSDQWSASIYNEDAEYKYISMARPYRNKDGLLVAGDTSNLYQIKGSGEHHFRYFVENRLNYCDSKWYSGEYPSNEVFLRIYTPVLADGETLAVPANPNITVTPFSNMYAGVKYKANGTLLQQRLEKNQAYTFAPPKTYNDAGEEVDEIFNDTETAIYGASEISSLGDLSGLYCGVINVSKASKLVELIVGNHTPGYTNDNFRELSVGTNRLLRKLDVTNCTGLGTYDQKTLSVVGCANIEEIYATGTNITGVELPAAGYLRVMHLPESINNLNIQNQLYIQDLSLASYDNIKTLCIDNCPTIDTVDLLNKCKNVERVRLTDLHWDLPDISFLRTLYHLKGLDERGQNTDDAYLIGTVYIENLTGAEYTEVRTHYPYLNITYGELVCTVTFKDTDKETTLYTQIIYNQSNCEDPVYMGLIDMPQKEQTVSHYYTWSGWSTKSDYITVEHSPLINVSNDLTVYPTFDEHIRKYPVNFYNNDGSLINVYAVDYGTEYFEYPGMTPVKQGTKNPIAYIFDGWQPEARNIRGSLDCYATYRLDDSAIYNVKLSDIDYVQDDTDKSITITRYRNFYEPIIRLNDSYDINGEAYSVKSIKGEDPENDKVTGFRNTDIEYVILPETLMDIGSKAFEGNKAITTITIPESVETIGSAAFKGCNNLLDIYYNARLARAERASSADPYPFADTMSKLGYTLHVGPRVEVVPKYLFTQSSDLKSVYGAKTITFEEGSCCEIIEEYAFTRSNCCYLDLPDSLLRIDSNAFAYCDMSELILPKNLLDVRSDAFAHCDELTYVYIPVGLQTIASTTFRGSLSVDFEIEAGSRFRWIDSCLINTSTGTLLMGRKNSVIPANMGITRLAEFCFNEVAIESLDIPDGVSTLDSYAIYNCKQLKHLTLPDTLSRIENFGLYACSFAEIKLPRNLQYLGTYAMVDNEYIQTLTIPSNVKSIGYQSFRGCTNLQSVIIETGDVYITKPDNATHDLFNGCSKLSEVTVNWSSDSTAFVKINSSAPWKAGTNNLGSQIIDVTVHYTDKDIVYNI